MSHKKILNTALFIIGILLIVGYVFINSAQFGICGIDDRVNCRYFLGFNFGHPLYYGLIPLIPILIILQFFRREVFVTWRKFAVVLIPIIIITIIITPVQCNAPLGLCFDKKSITRFLSMDFAILSLIIIFTKSFLIRRREKLNSQKWQR